MPTLSSSSLGGRLSRLSSPKKSPSRSVSTCSAGAGCSKACCMCVSSQGQAKEDSTSTRGQQDTQDTACWGKLYSILLTQAKPQV